MEVNFWRGASPPRSILSDRKRLQRIRGTGMRSLLDHDDCGSNRSTVMNGIDTGKLEHDAVRKRFHAFRHHALTAFLLTLAATLTPPPLLAEDAQPDQVAAQGQACMRGCVSEFRVCQSDTKTKSEPGRCDTGAITCTVTCRECVSALRQCAAKDGSASAPAPQCYQAYADCARATRAKRNPPGRAPILFTSGDGASVESAIVITGARDSFEGITAESFWVSRHRDNWRKGRQFLLNHGGRRFDQIEYTLPDGSKQTLYFDVTDFFGKM